MNAKTLNALYKSGRWTRVKHFLEERSRLEEQINQLVSKFKEVDAKLVKEIDEFTKSPSAGGLEPGAFGGELDEYSRGAQS